MPELGWFPIFRGGKQVDSLGREHDGDKLIEQAIKNFNPKEHEPPIVVGHPKDNSPAFGWISDLKVETENGVKVLYAKAKQVSKEFLEWLKKGLYKKRSASFYADGRLRHVGFLGAMPPAVKGLADINLNEKEDFLEFEEVIEKEENKEGLVKKIVDGVIQGLSSFFEHKEEKKERKQKTSKGDSMGKIELTEEQLQEKIQQAVKEAEEKARKEAEEKLKKEFAEKERQARFEAEKEKIKSFVDSLKKEGKVLPAWEKAGLVDFMLSLNDDTEIEFGEEKNKKTKVEWFKEFLQGLEKVVDFKEVATRDKEPQGVRNEFEDLPVDEESLKLHKKVLAFMEEQKKNGREVSYEEALNLVVGG